MKRYFSSLVLLALTLMSNATPRTAQEAIKVAQEFASVTPALNKYGNMMTSSSNMSLVRSRVSNVESSPYYIINIDDDNGYIIVSGDDRFKPILGYSNNGHVNNEEEMPEALRYWLQSLTNEMNYAIANGYEKPAKTKATQYNVSIEPLLTSEWAQDNPFNKLIPNYATGCVATGIAQVMYYWKYPVHGIGSHTNGNNSAYSADFANTTYDWANMKDTYGGKYDTAAQIEAVSTLMLHIGIATDMIWRSPQEGSSTGNIFAAHALINFFGYNKYLHAEDRDYIGLEDWKALIIEQLMARRPIPYNGVCDSERSQGHFFVLDGYDASTDLFHFNWGWGGVYDGYYNISSLEPGEGGIGAGLGSYNYGQQIYVDVQPEETGEYVAHYDCDDITPSETKMNKRNFFFKTMNMRNNSLNFNGDFGMAIYSKDGSCQIVKSLNEYPKGFFSGANVIGEFPLYYNLSDIKDGEYIVCLTAIHKDYPDKVNPIRALYGKNNYFKMSAKGDYLTFEGISNTIATNPVAIETTTADEDNAPVYSLTGTKVSNMSKGIYIRNRKKIIR